MVFFWRRARGPGLDYIEWDLNYYLKVKLCLNGGREGGEGKDNGDKDEKVEILPFTLSFPLTYL